MRILQPIFLFFSKLFSGKKESPAIQLKLIDYYLVREVMSPFLYSLVAFITLYIIYDLSIHFNDFFEKGIKFGPLLHYYLSSIPFIFVNATPVALLMAALYCLGQLAKNSEITAMQASGIGLLRISYPFFFIGIILSLMVLLANETVVPRSIEISESLRQEEIKKKETAEMKTWKEFAYKSPYSGRYWVGEYDPDKQILTNAIIREFRADGSLKIKYTAKEVRWVEDGWWMFEGNLALFDLESKQIGSEDFAKKPLRAAKTYETPEDFLNSRTPTTLMNIAELRQHIKIHDPSEAVYKSEWVDLHYKISFPFISLVVIFLGVPLGLLHSGRRGSGALAGLGISLALCLAYYAFTMITLALGKSGHLAPILAAWLPNVVFIGIGIALAYKIFKR